MPLRGGIDWIEYFDKIIEELETKLISLSRALLTLNDNEDKGTNTDDGETV